MHADLAVDYFQARSLDAEEQLLNSTVKQYEQALELTESRFQGGIASEVEVEQAKTALQAIHTEVDDYFVKPRGYCVAPQHHRTEAARACVVGVASGISRSLSRIRKGYGIAKPPRDPGKMYICPYNFWTSLPSLRWSPPHTRPGGNI